jgi:5-methylcytosine-specific restriction endonuclease McrA
MNNRDYDPHTYTADQQAALVSAMKTQDVASTAQQPKYKYYERNQRWEWARMRKDRLLRDDIEWKDPGRLWTIVRASLSKCPEQDIDEGSEPVKFFCKAFYATL